MCEAMQNFDTSRAKIHIKCGLQSKAAEQGTLTGLTLTAFTGGCVSFVAGGQVFAARNLL